MAKRDVAVLGVVRSGGLVPGARRKRAVFTLQLFVVAAFAAFAAEAAWLSAWWALAAAPALAGLLAAVHQVLLARRRPREAGAAGPPGDSGGFYFIAGEDQFVPCRAWNGLPEPPVFLRCAACDCHLDRDPLCSDVAVLTLHWMSEHRERWLELHPEDAAYI